MNSIRRELLADAGNDQFMSPSMNIEIAGEMVEAIQQEPTPVFQNISQDNARIEDIISYILHPFRTARADARIRRKILLVGLSGTGKSNFALGLADAILQRKEEDSNIKDPFFLVMRDLTKSYQIGHDYMGWIDNPIGKMTPEDYYKGQVIDEQFGDALHNYVPGNMLEIQEGVAVSQTFGKDFRLVGIPRINLGNIRTDVQNGAGIFTIGITTDEIARREFIQKRMEKNQLAEGERVVSFGNPAVGGQQLTDMLHTTHALFRDRVVKPSNPYFYRGDFVRYMENHPEEIMPLTRDVVLPRIMEGLYGSANDSRGAIAYNEPIDDEVKLEEDIASLKAMQEKHEALNVLMWLAQNHPTPSERMALRFTLQQWGIAA